MIAWYVLNESSGGGGSRGLLALQDREEAAAKGTTWRRRKDRPTLRKKGGGTVEATKAELEATETTFREIGEGAAYRTKDEAAYKPTDYEPRFGERHKD